MINMDNFTDLGFRGDDLGNYFNVTSGSEGMKMMVYIPGDRVAPARKSKQFVRYIKIRIVTILLEV